MRSEATPKLAFALMMGFAERTGVVDPDILPRRYLWTDGFAVCNFLEIGRADLAIAMIDLVHHTLGRFARADARTGWISGLDDEAGEAHPTHGGLRIGKPLLERAAYDRIDERLEWDRDGQYFHYLTKWMHALDQLTRATGDPIYNTWARELAEIAARKFVHGSPPQMYWKMSIDLSRPLVASMGQHDPLDGFVTCSALAATAAEIDAGGPDLREITATFASMIEPRRLPTGDALGIGGLLVDAYRLAQLPTSDPNLIATILTAARLGLEHYAADPERAASAVHRLAFRELGLAIGLAAVSRMPDLAAQSGLARHVWLREEIEEFWQRPGHRETRAWIEHADINDVMLATSLAPDGFLARNAVVRR